MIQHIRDFIKKETVLVLAFILAVFSCFFIPPDKEYISYIDTHTLLILFCLMAVMAGFKSLGLFQYIGEALIKRFRTTRGLVAVLVFLCFFSSMFITNDVALITFVPLALLILSKTGMGFAICFVVTLMTIAANLGSMMTPVGNPQNLYLYSTSGMALSDFILLMLPYTLMAALILTVCICIYYKSVPVSGCKFDENNSINWKKVIYYMILFILCLLCVVDMLSVELLFVIVLIAVAVENRSLLKEVDYSLLSTFVCFFVFTGNIGRIEAFNAWLMGILNGHVIPVSVGLSQIISNVPAALLLSGFTDSYSKLIIGTNLGGLGTLIASMASLISFKQVAVQYPASKKYYIVLFTVWNIIFLILLSGLAFLLDSI